MCVLLLRGPQTPGELRGRSERMHRFEELDDVQSTLQKLMQHDPPLVKVLPRQPGTKESRYAQLLSGNLEAWDTLAANDAADRSSTRISSNQNIENEVAELRREVEDLKQQFASFRKQFE
jgi:uncharacterized protein YceH (UPF0502 family)